MADYVLFEVTGDPAKVFADVKLPPGASVAVIAPGGQAERMLSHTRGFRSFDSAWQAKFRSVLSGPGPANPGADKQAFEPDARARALLRGVEIAREDLKASGGAYSLREVQTLLHGVSRQRIDKQVRDGHLLAVPGPSARRCYPTVQFRTDGSVVRGLKAVHEALATQNPWAVLNFLVQPDDRLGGRRPIDLLKADDIEAVVDAARTLDQPDQ